MQRKRVTWVAGIVVLLLAMGLGPVAFGFGLFDDLYGHTLHWDAADMPVRYMISTANMPSLPGFLDAMTIPFATWEAVPSAAITFQFLGTTSEAITNMSPDGINLISWITPGTDTVFMGGGAFGISSMQWFSTADGHILESDVHFNLTEGWSTTGQAGRADVQGVVTHELGHFMGIGHSTETEATMASGPTWFSVHPRLEETVEMRTLHDDDIEALSTIYPVPGVPFVAGGGGAAAGGGNGCFIATAAYGTPLATQVRSLSEFRDERLLTNAPGRWAVEQYERYGPSAAAVIEEHPLLKAAARTVLWPLAAACKDE